MKYTEENLNRLVSLARKFHQIPDNIKIEAQFVDRPGDGAFASVTAIHPTNKIFQITINRAYEDKPWPLTVPLETTMFQRLPFLVSHEMEHVYQTLKKGLYPVNGWIARYQGEMFIHWGERDQQPWEKDADEVAVKFCRQHHFYERKEQRLIA